MTSYYDITSWRCQWNCRPFFMVCMLRKFRCRKLMPNGSIVAARCYACLQFCTVIDFPNFGRECISRFENLIKKIVLPMHWKSALCSLNGLLSAHLFAFIFPVCWISWTFLLLQWNENRMTKRVRLDPRKRRGRVRFGWKVKVLLQPRKALPQSMKWTVTLKRKTIQSLE